MPLTSRIFEGIVSLQRKGGWVQPWRLPYGDLALFPSKDVEGLVDRAEMAAGVRLRFETDSHLVGIECAPADSARKFDLTLNGKLIQSVVLPPKAGDLLFHGLPARRKVVEIWLPHDLPVRLRNLLVEDNAVARPVPDDRPRWIAYGSSITHCREAHSPARTWPSVVARAARLNLTCLGYGGNCHLEPMVAFLIRDMPADFISLKVGINCYGAASLSPRTFKAALIGFVRIIRERQPRVPIAVISPIYSRPRKKTPNAVGMTLVMMREEIEDAVRRMRTTWGDRNLRYFDGLKLFDAKLAAAHQPDELHPDGDGYEIIGRGFLRLVLPWLRTRGSHVH